MARPVTSDHSQTWVWPLRPNRFDPCCTATREITQSRVRACSMAMSKTVPSVPDSLMVTVRSKISPTTRVSPGRCSKRRMLTSPVVIT